MSEQESSYNNEDKEDQEIENRQENEIDDGQDDSNQSQINLKNIKAIELHKYKEKEHFFSKNLKEDLKNVKLREYPKNDHLDQIFDYYQQIQQFKPSQEEIFLKIDDKAYQMKQSFTVNEIKQLQTERDKKYFKYLLKIRKNFVNEEIFCNLRKKIKLSTLGNYDNLEDKKENQSNQQSLEVSSDVFSNYSEFY